MAELFKFQKESVRQLLNGKHIMVAGCGSGKNPTSMVWAMQQCKATGKRDIVVVTTASKSRTTDHHDDLVAFCGEDANSLASFSVLSWHKLARWTDEHIRQIPHMVFVFDEIQRGSAGVSSGMGKAFLKITMLTHDWAGFTGTPGDNWLKFYPYFTACGLVRNKTGFMSKYATVQTYKGYPEIIGWCKEDELRRMWAAISYAPDTSQVIAELPAETHKTQWFKKPTSYNKVLKTRTNDAGEFLDTSGALVAELRRQCFTKEKEEWIKDLVTDLEAGCVFFYNYIATGDALEAIVKSALPKDAKVWRIDGKHHDIPTAETIGPKDMVICQWQSGSEALNLQFLHYWVAVELCYSYSTAIQGRGRIKRVGQTHPMTFYYLLTTGTIEEDVLEILKNKGEFSERNWCVSKKLIGEDDG